MKQFIKLPTCSKWINEMERGVIVIVGPPGSGKTTLTNSIITDETRTYVGFSNEIDLKNTVSLIDNIKSSELTQNLIVECRDDLVNQVIEALSKQPFKRVIIEVNSEDVDLNINIDSSKVAVSVAYCKTKTSHLY